VIWDQAILWAQGIAWNDPLMTVKQTCYGAGSSLAKIDGTRAILWSNSILWSHTSIVEGDRAIMWSQSCSGWNDEMVDPSSTGSAGFFELPGDESAPASYQLLPLDSPLIPTPPPPGS
jgi:hypothetical protein